MTAINPFAATSTLATRSLLQRGMLPPPEQRVDLPEIQESSRVSFSDAAMAAAPGQVRDSLQRPTFTDEQGAGSDPRLQAYLKIAAL